MSDIDYVKTIGEINKQKNNAYWERNQLVAALSKIYPSGIAKHSEDDKGWEDDWRNIVVVYLPKEFCQFPDEPTNVLRKDGGWYYQLTWHIHDTERPMFDHLTVDYDYKWDGHTTEEKYRRLRGLKLRINPHS